MIIECVTEVPKRGRVGKGGGGGDDGRKKKKKQQGKNRKKQGAQNERMVITRIY